MVIAGVEEIQVEFSQCREVGIGIMKRLDRPLDGVFPQLVRENISPVREEYFINAVIVHLVHRKRPYLDFVLKLHELHRSCIRQK
jgi:hypothetical protein